MTESINQTPSYEIGDKSTETTGMDMRIVRYDIIKLPTTESDKRGSLFTKKEALIFSNRHYKKRVELSIFTLLRPNKTMDFSPFVFELHVSRESCKKGLFWNGALNGKIADIMVVVAEVAAKTNGVEVEFINDDFDATMVFKYQ